MRLDSTLDARLCMMRLFFIIPFLFSCLLIPTTAAFLPRPSNGGSVTRICQPNIKKHLRFFVLSSTPASPSTGTAGSNSNSQAAFEEDEPITSNVDAVICGGGPAGLLSAIMLAQKYPTMNNIKVYDRLSAPPNADDDAIWKDAAKFYLIGLGGRGQAALREFGVWDEVEKRSVGVVGRKDWPPDSKEGVERIFTKEDKPITTQVLPRDKLVGILHQHISTNYANRVELNYGYEVHPVDFEHKNGTAVLIEVAKCSEEIARLNPSAAKTAAEEPEDVLCSTTDAVTRVSTSFLIAADGTVRTVANAMEREDQKKRKGKGPLRRLFVGRPFRVERYPDDNQRVYKTIPIQVPPDWRYDVNYSARSKGGRFNFDALPANGKGSFCGVALLLKGDAMAQADTDPIEFRKLLDDYLSAFSPLLDDETVAATAKKPVSYLPAFRFAGPRLRQGKRCLLLGDCAHTVKPYFGLGANSALEDVKILSRILDATNGDIPKAVVEFSKQRAPEAKAMVRLSRELDRPGQLGLLTFILPLILDSIFNGLAPRWFSPNIITMLQREQYTFQQVARKKRLDRLLQLTILGSALLGASKAAMTLIRCVARTLGVSRSNASAGVVGAAATLLALRRFSKFMVPGLAPADVLVRLSNKVANSKSHLTPLRKLAEKSKQESTNGESFLTPLGNKNKD